MYPQFGKDIWDMNQRYQLPNVQTLEDVIKRMPQFKDILDKEFTELGDIESWMENKLLEQTPNMDDVLVGAKVMMADLLGDIIVYCASEAMRWGLPLDGILMIIMASNTSKLGADGKPIINPSNGKFEQGPKYWKPEPVIEHYLTNGPQSQILFHRDEHGVVTYEFQESPEQAAPAPGGENAANSIDNGE